MVGFQNDVPLNSSVSFDILNLLAKHYKNKERRTLNSGVRIHIVKIFSSMQYTLLIYNINIQHTDSEEHTHNYWLYNHKIRVSFKSYYYKNTVYPTHQNPFIHLLYVACTVGTYMSHIQSILPYWSTFSLLDVFMASLLFRFTHFQNYISLTQCFTDYHAPCFISKVSCSNSAHFRAFCPSLLHKSAISYYSYKFNTYAYGCPPYIWHSILHLKNTQLLLHL